jgi:hypothetical protein
MNFIFCIEALIEYFKADEKSKPKLNDKAGAIHSPLATDEQLYIELFKNASTNPDTNPLDNEEAVKASMFFRKMQSNVGVRQINSL